MSAFVFPGKIPLEALTVGYWQRPQQLYAPSKQRMLREIYFKRRSKTDQPRTKFSAYLLLYSKTK